MMPRITANKKHINGPFVVPIFIHHRIDRRKEQFSSTAFAAPGIQDRGEIPKYNTVGRQISLPGWRRSPTKCLPYASRQLANECARVTYGIEIVKNFSPVVLDLRQQNVVKRSVVTHSILLRPLALQNVIVAIGETVSYTHLTLP